jgi:uncharacterized protein YbaR (Trm112 family)
MRENKLSIFSRLRCPVCQRDGLLRYNKELLECSACKEKFPIINDILVLLSRDEIFNFLKSDELKKFIRLKNINHTLGQKNFIEVFRRIERYTSSFEFQREYEKQILKKTSSWSEYVKRSIETLAEKTHVYEADVILDWPTG